MAATVTHLMRVMKTDKGKYILVVDNVRCGTYKNERKAWKTGCKKIEKLLKEEREA